MHLFKRFAGVMLVLVLTVSILPSASARQLYSYNMSTSDVAEIAVMVDEISDQTFSTIDATQVRAYIEHFLYSSDFSAVNGGRYPYTNAQGYWAGKSVSDGTFYQVVSATGCFAYCKFVSLVIYGTAGTRCDLNEKAGRITADGLKSFLETYAQAGEHIRVDSKHSVTFISGNENGFYYMDYAGDQNPRIMLRYSTYSDFAAYCNALYKKVWIYDADPAVNVEKTKEPEVIEPADWLAEYVVIAEELGLTASANTLDYNSELTLAETVTFAARAHSLFTVGGVEFNTENAANWYDPYANYLKENQILKSDLDYAGVASRERFVDLLYAAVPADMELTALNAAITFADANEISNIDAASVFYQAGILTGVQQDNGIFFYPNNSITRGEAIALITRLAIADFRVILN